LAAHLIVFAAGWLTVYELPKSKKRDKEGD
jgi:hypothetical protein